MKMYDELAFWWPLVSPASDYEEEASFYMRTLIENCRHPPKTLLEIGSGGGNNASYMKKAFDATTLVDLAPGMLDVSRRLNPDCDHVVGDLRTVRLGRTFDCVFVHDAVCYLTTEADLRQAIATAFVHCVPGGSALFAPDHVREHFRESTDCGGEDDGKRGLRYLEWTWDPNPDDTSYVVDYVFALREEDGTMHTVHDHHVEGVFSRTDWLKWLREAGFEAVAVPFDHSELEPGSYELFVCRRP